MSASALYLSTHTESSSANAGDLNCLICHKSYATIRALKKHETYCRRRQAQGPRSRRRACIPCVAAKTRCDGNARGCSACARRKCACQYDPSTQCTQSDPSLSPDAVTECGTSISGTSKSSLKPEVNDVPYATPYLASNLHNHDTLTALVRPGEKATYYLFVLADDFTAVGSQLGIGSARQRKFMQSPYFSRFLPRYVQISATAFDASALATACIDTRNLFTKRTLKDARNLRDAAIALQTLQSYPRMLLRKKTFPPFIHPEAYPHNDSCTTYPAPLENAITICSMLYKQDDARMHLSPCSEKAIRTEVKNILQKCPTFDDWELLASLQALTIYCILRSCGACVDIGPQLLVAVNATCSHIVLKRGDLTTLKDSMASDLAWKDWIFAESRRRTTVVFRSLNAILNMSICFPCPVEPSFAYGPLPASKAMWRAENTIDWDIERHASGMSKGTHGMLMNGELAMIRASYDICGPQRLQWSQWLVGADELGMLALTVAGITRDEELASKRT